MGFMSSLSRGIPSEWDSVAIRYGRPIPWPSISADFRKQLLRERNAARRDSRLKARFLSFRLNVPTADESQILLTVEDWKFALARRVPPPSGETHRRYRSWRGESLVRRVRYLGEWEV